MFDRKFLAGRLCAISVLTLAASAQAQVAPIVIEHDVTVQSMVSDRFTWTDSSGQPRVAVLAHDNVGVPGAPPFPQVYGVALREFRYQANGMTRIANVTTYGNGGYGGFGYVVEHTAAGACVGDDSPLGHWTQANFQRIFEGRHHVIFRYTQNYPRNCPNQSRTIPVTIDWIFSTGRDNPVYAINYDVDLAGPNAPEGTLYDDSRAPYGELNIDGDGSMNVEGVAWGDRYKFTASGAPLTTASSWTYTTANTVPFIKTWIATSGPNNTGDATMGLVQTQTIDQQDAGGARDAAASPNGVDLRNLWQKTTGTYGNGCPAGGGAPMPCGDDWAYQALGDSLGAAGTNNTRITWKTMYGFVGPPTYNSNNVLGGAGATPPGFPKKSYSVYVILGKHSSGPVEAQLAQVEDMQSVSLSAATGIVVPNGPAGITRADSVTYSPPGYNHIYGALAFSASSNQLDANIAVGAGTLTNPMMIVSNYTGGAPLVTFNGVSLTADVDYFASLRTSSSELWITLNRSLSGPANHLVIAPAAAPATPTGFSATAVSSAQVNLSWSAVAGATYQVDRRSTGGAFTQIATPMTNAYSDSGLAAGAAYLYRVRAVNASGTSGNSTPDVATTIVFTDPLLTGTTVKAVHLAEIRTAVDAVRALAGKAAGMYTDSAVAGVTVKAIHVTEVRSSLDDALTALGVPTSAYTDTALGGIAVKAVHFQEIRDRVQ